MSTSLRRLYGAVLLFAALVVANLNAAPAPPGAADANGDPLPPGVIARLGTLRLRHVCNGLAWAPDGQSLASAGTAGAIRIWDAASGKLLRQCDGVSNPINQTTLVYLPDGKTLASKGFDNMLRLWDTKTGREVRTIALTQTRQVAALAPGLDADTLIELCADNTLHVLDLTTGREDSRLKFDGNRRQGHVALSANGARAAGWSLPDELTVWDAPAGKELFHMPTKLVNLMGLAFSRDGKRLAASGPTGTLVVWDDSGKELNRYENTGVQQWLTFAPDGNRVAWLGGDHAIHLWDLDAGKEVRRFEAPASNGPIWGNVPALSFSPDGKILAAPQGAAIHFWSVETGKLLHRFTGHTGAVEDLRFSPDSRLLVSCGKDGMARQWDVSAGKEINSWTNPAGPAAPMIAAPDGASVLALTPNGWVRAKLGEDEGGGPVPASWGLRFYGHMNLVLSEDGKSIMWTEQNQSIHLWDAAANKEMSGLPRSTDFSATAAVSPDSKYLALGGAQSSLRLWDVAAAKEVRVFGEAATPGRFRAAQGLAFSPDGGTLLEIENGKLTLYEVATGRERLQILRPNILSARYIAARRGSLANTVFSPNGEVLAANSEGEIAILSAANGRELARLPGQGSAITSMIFSPDGKTLATGDEDGLILVRDVKEWVARPRLASADVKPEKLAALWDSLRDADPAKAYKAIMTLAASPKASAPFLREKLTAADTRVKQWLQDLNGNLVDAREKAEKELTRSDGSAAPALRKALEAEQSPEARKRLQDLLDGVKDSAKVTEDVRAVRALEALEHSDAPESTAVLEILAKDGPGASVKERAKAALTRLKRQAAAP